MDKSSVTEILKNFSENDLVKFGDFINSPYFNKNKNLMVMFGE